MNLYHNSKYLGSISDVSQEGFWMYGQIDLASEGAAYREFFNFMTDEEKRCSRWLAPVVCTITFLPRAFGSGRSRDRKAGGGGHTAFRDRHPCPVSFGCAALFGHTPAGDARHPLADAPSLALLRDEPASHALITFAALGHPHWNVHPPKFDVAYAFMQSIEGLDLVRAQLLTEIVYRQKDLSLSPFDIIQPDVQERITFLIGNRYSTLRDWLLEYREGSPLPLDHFFRKLFGGVLSQAGFGSRWV